MNIRKQRGKNKNGDYMIAIIIRTFILYCAVAVCVRLMGKRQLGQLQPGELVVTLIISEIAAAPITDSSVPLLNTLIPLFLLVSLEIFSSLICRKNVSFRYLYDGRPIPVIKNGKVIQKNLKKLRLTIDDVLSALRQKNIFDLNEVEYAVVETNGVLSVMQKRKYQPLSDDIMKNPKTDTDCPCAVIIDGILLRGSLDTVPVQEEKIFKKLKNEKIKQEDVYLMMVDKNEKYLIIKKEKE